MKLLVNAPTGLQELLDVGEGGGYFGVDRVLWDERVDGPLPEITLGAMKRVNDVLVVDEATRAATAAAKMAAEKYAFIGKVDADVDAVIKAVIGERSSEYELAEKDAIAFAAGGYLGTAPSSVSAWATAKGWTNQAAADDIIATATAWRAAQAAIRANRLARKEAARNAADVPALDAVKAQWAGFLAVIRGQLGL